MSNNQNHENNDPGEAIFEDKADDLRKSLNQFKTTEDALLYYSSIIENSYDAIYSKTLDGTITSWNPAAERLYGYTAEEMIGKSVQRIVPADKTIELMRLLERLRQGKRIVNLETIRLCKNGARIDVSITISPVRSLNNVIIGASVIARDITERKTAARQYRSFLRNVMWSVSGRKLKLCDTEEDLPPPISPVLHFQSIHSNNLSILRRQVRTLAENTGYENNRIHDLVTAVGEASMNAVVHAGGGHSALCMKTRSNRNPQNTIQVWIRDKGRGISLEQLPQATLERGFTTAQSLGHGFWLILQMIDRIWLLTGTEGTTLVMEQDETQNDPSWLDAQPFMFMSNIDVNPSVFKLPPVFLSSRDA